MNVKPSKLSGFRPLVALGLLLSAASCGEPPIPAPPSPSPPGPQAETDFESRPPTTTPLPQTTDGPPNCVDLSFATAAQSNAASLRELRWAPFRRPEIGWETYAPLIGREVGTACPPTSQGFAAAIARWQGGQGLTGDGLMSAAAFAVMKGRWQSRRPFVTISAKGACPAPPVQLADARPEEGYAGKQVQMRPAVLEAYRRMAAAARASPEVAADPRNLTIFSAYRSPEYDAARCLRDQNCNGVTRASCSPHRTGLALDLFVGAAPDYGPDSSADPNRLFQSKSAAYAWLLANGERFGFVNYPFEPWHWEWVGEAP